MYSALIMLPFIVVILALVFTLIRGLVRVWLEHRVKIALLERFEQKPHLLKSVDAINELLVTPEEQEPGQRLDYILTGAFLAVIGVVCAVAASSVGRTELAAGTYFGGVACAVLGFILALLGLIMRFLARTPIRNRRRRLG